LNSNLFWLFEKYPNIEVLLCVRELVIDLTNYQNQFLDLSNKEDEQKLKKKKYSLYSEEVKNEVNSFVILYKLYYYNNDNYDIEIEIITFLQIQNEFIQPEFNHLSYYFSFNSESEDCHKYSIIKKLELKKCQKDLINKIIDKLKENQNKFPNCSLKESLNYDSCKEWIEATNN
jgi:hypothetical protein